MEQDNFQKNLLKHTEDFRKVLSTPSGDWSVKGFIDIAKNIYTISVDTKVVEKIMMWFRVLHLVHLRDISAIEIQKRTSPFRIKITTSIIFLALSIPNKKN